VYVSGLSATIVYDNTYTRSTFLIADKITLANSVGVREKPERAVLGVEALEGSRTVRQGVFPFFMYPGVLTSDLRYTHPNKKAVTTCAMFPDPGTQAGGFRSGSHMRPHPSTRLHLRPLLPPPPRRSLPARRFCR
jgi:hypothetical protein